MKSIWVNLKMFLWMTLLTGAIYPLLITGIAQLFFKDMANGGLETLNEKVVGANLIGQKFSSDKYFWGRPSFVDYNPLPSGGSNLGPTSAVLKKTVAERKAMIIKAHGIAANAKIPAELLFASGSGLDPHISPEAAYFQVDRVVKSRKLNPEGKEKILHMINELTEKRRFGFLGKPYVNVLLLNKSLVNISERAPQNE